MRYEVKVSKLENVKEGSNIRGFANVVFADSFKVSNIAILENKDGNLFVSMPRYESTKDNEYKDICNPISKEFREDLYGAILDTFEAAEPGKSDRTEKVFGEDSEELAFNVKVTPFEREGSNIRGLGRIYIEDAFVVSNVSVLAGKNGNFIAMPSYKTKQVDENGKSQYQDIAYPVTKEFREKLYGEITSAFEKAKVDGRGGDTPPTPPAPGASEPEKDLPFR